MNLKGRKVVLHDMCLRDGMHAKAHRISLEQMVAVATALDAAGVPLIEITHGDGLGGASVNYGFPSHSDEEYLRGVIPRLNKAKVSALLLPGIGTVEHLHLAKDCGVATIRVATHCTEADVSEQHIALSRKLGLDTVGFLMMAHMVEPPQLLAQAKLMESYGANVIYCTDSAGYMLPDDVTARIGLLREKLSPATEIGFHGHHNMALGIANSLAAIQAGARQVECTVNGIGERAGNTAFEEVVMAIRVHGEALGFDELRLQVLKRVLIELELAFERTIGQAAPPKRRPKTRLEDAVRAPAERFPFPNRP